MEKADLGKVPMSNVIDLTCCLYYKLENKDIIPLLIQQFQIHSLLEPVKTLIYTQPSDESRHVIHLTALLLKIGVSRKCIFNAVTKIINVPKLKHYCVLNFVRQFSIGFLESKDYGPIYEEFWKNPYKICDDRRVSKDYYQNTDDKKTFKTFPWSYNRPTEETYITYLVEYYYKKLI